MGCRDLQARATGGTDDRLRVERQWHAACPGLIRPWIDLYKVDLKSFDDRHYRELGGRIEPILQTIRSLHERGIWLEIVTLLIPGFNDSADEIDRLTGFIAGVSPLIPWHVTAFHQDYRMQDPVNTTPEMLPPRRGDRPPPNGLKYVYAGNLPGQVGSLEHTHCHGCNARLVERYGYRVLPTYRLTERRGPAPIAPPPSLAAGARDSPARSLPRHSCPGRRRLRIDPTQSSCMRPGTSGGFLLKGKRPDLVSLLFMLLT